MNKQALLFPKFCLAVTALSMTGLCGCKGDSGTASSAMPAAASSTGNATGANSSGTPATAASNPAAEAEKNRYLSRYHRDGQGNPTR